MTTLTPDQLIDAVQNFDPTSFDVHDLCKEHKLDIELFGLTITLPIGIELSTQFVRIPDPGDVTAALLAQVNAALAPLSPFFDVLDLLLTLKDMVEALASLDPFKIAAALPKFKVKLDKLKKLIPQLCLPLTIKGTIRVVIKLLVSIRADLLDIILRQTRIDLSAQRGIALGSLSLQAAVTCAQANLDVQLNVVRNNAAPLNRFLAALALFASLIPGAPEIPQLGDMSGSATVMLDPIDTLIAALQALHDAIPL